jgi:hypothetical protein
MSGAPETKAEAFRRLAGDRQGVVVKKLDLMRNLMRRDKYESTEAERAEIVGEIETALADLIQAWGLERDEVASDPLDKLPAGLAERAEVVIADGSQASADALAAAEALGQAIEVIYPIQSAECPRHCGRTLYWRDGELPPVCPCEAMVEQTSPEDEVRMAPLDRPVPPIATEAGEVLDRSYAAWALEELGRGNTEEARIFLIRALRSGRFEAELEDG